MTKTSRGVAGLLLLAALLGGLAVTVAYGFSVEYADTAATALETAIRTVGDWWFTIAIVAVPAALAALLRRTTRVVLAAVLVVGLTVLGVGAGAVLGAQEKYERYPATPNCTAELDRGPAMPVTQAAQRAYESIEHPAPFSGGGSSGVDGCSSQLMVRDDDPTDHYRSALPGAGWKIVSDTDLMLRAEHDDEAFELTQDEFGDWTVWIGPRDLASPDTHNGRVGA